MAGKLLWKLSLYCASALLIGTWHFAHSSPLFPSNSLTSQSTGAARLSNGRIFAAELDKPLDAVLEAVMEVGGNVLFLVPQREFEKRDPPDLGTGRSYSGQRTAKVMWGQLASNSPSGPGRRKRNASDWYLSSMRPAELQLSSEEA